MRNFIKSVKPNGPNHPLVKLSRKQGLGGEEFTLERERERERRENVKIKPERSKKDLGPFQACIERI